MKFTEAKLEQAIIDLMGKQGYPHVSSETISREPGEVLIKEDLRNFLANHEMYVAQFYIKTDKLKQAEVRLEYLLDHYPDSSVAKEAEQTLASLKEGKKPRGSWKDWLPELGMPDWETFTSFKSGGGSGG